MLLVLITLSSFIFILFSLSLPLQLLSLSPSDMRLLSLSFWKNLASFTKSQKFSLLGASLSFLIPRMSPKKNINTADEVVIAAEMSVLDLPDLVFETILEKLPAEGLCRMASVCSSLREKCVSDHLWEKHMEEKWGRVIGPAAFREWQGCNSLNEGGKQKGLIGYFIDLIRFGIRSGGRKRRCFSTVDSIMSRYLALESGKFWFPAQVYNRENGHAGFMLSCYDAMLSYDRRTDTFNARYPPHGSRAFAVESGVTWDRLRSPLVETSPHDLHLSDCLHELHPGDHIEIQWRRNKEFPYGWWYGVVGHLETCDGSGGHCRCQNSESVVLEFKQYTPGSRWRRAIVSRKDHREEGNEADGFYGGVQKLYGEEEISMWKKLWPAEALE